MALIPKEYFNCVLALGRKPETEWIATCFLCSKKIESKGRYHFLVTNKHVFDGEKELYVRLYNNNTKEYESLKATLQNENGNILYSTHQNADVATVIIQAGDLLRAGFTWTGFDVDTGMMSSKDYYEAGGSVGARVFMLGFPMGLVDIYKNDPICRGGYIAREENDGYLLDIQNFPGNSGSPIISCPEIVKVHGTTAMTSCALIGIVNSYKPYNKPLINTQTGNTIGYVDENSGLAYAYSVESIREVINMELKRNGISELKHEEKSFNSPLPQ